MSTLEEYSKKYITTKYCALLRRVCEGKKICQICDVERIATCGAPLIANLERTFNHRKTYHKVQCELARKVVKGLLEKEVSQKGFAMSSDFQNAIKK
jgi:hypothetical protein